VHDAQVFGHGIKETFIQYIVLCGRNTGFVISELCFEVRFRYLRNLDSCTPLQLAEIRVMCIDFGDSAAFKTFKIPALTINDHKVAPFSDIILRHRISKFFISGDRRYLNFRNQKLVLKI